MSLNTHLEERIQQLEQQRDELVAALEIVAKNDKTVYNYKGRHAANKDGLLPDSGRWSTPREIAESAIAKAKQEGV